MGMSSMNVPRMPDLRRSSLTTFARWLRVAVATASAALGMLVAHILVPLDVLQIASLWILGASLLCAWAGIVTWRMPVFKDRTLFLFAVAWGGGMALSVWLAGWAFPTHASIWRLSIQWLALTLSTAVGALLLRALLRKRTTPVIGRLLSLISPLVVLVVILVTSLRSAPR
jgi:hypothetical protein